MNKKQGLKLFVLIGLVMKLLMLAGMVLVSGGLAGCTSQVAAIGSLQTTSEYVELGGAESVEVAIEMGAGELDVSGGADELLDAEFTFNVPRWEPEVDYSVRNGNGRLTIKQPSTDGINLPSSYRYEWDIQLNDDVPLDLQVNVGAGEGMLDLSGLNLQSLDLRSGAGDVEVWLGDTALETAVVDAGVGRLVLDLSGDWQQDATIDVNTGIGDLTVRVPRDVDVEINTDLGIGDLEADGFARRGGAYVHDASSGADVTLMLDIDGGIGQITLELVD